MPAPRRGAASGTRRLRIAEPGLLLLVALTAVVDAAASLIRHANFGSGVDLAIFDQVVWRFSHFASPYSSIEGQHIFADHFHPLVAILAPLYWIWSDPRMLLVAQAVLVAASIVPVFLFARGRLARGPAYLLAAGYAVFWGLQVGVLFDFHEVAFAPLLIGLAILLADRGRVSTGEARTGWRSRHGGWFWLTVVALLLVKEDMSLLVIAFGVWRLSVRDVRLGIGLILLGAAWYGITTQVLIPHYSPGGSYDHWTYGQLGRTPLAALGTAVTSPWKVVQIAFSPAHKLRTMAALFGVFLFLSLGTRLVILTLPLLAERFLSTNPVLWSAHDHYSMPIAPVLAMAAAAGLANLGALAPQRRRRRLVVAGAAGVLAVNLAVTEAFSSDSAPNALTRGSLYRVPAWAPGARDALAHVPSGASLITVVGVLPRVSERDVVGLINPRSVGVGQYVLANIVRPDCCWAYGDADIHQLGTVIDQQLPQLVPVFYEDGWLLARRRLAGQAPSSGVLEPVAAGAAPRLLAQAAGWQWAYVATQTRFAACTSLWLRHDPGTAGCYGRAMAPLAGAQRRLSRRLDRAALGLRGGCRQLAGVAASATGQLTADLAAVAAETSGGSAASVAPPVNRYTFDVGTRDLPDMLDRFLVLCLPRR